MTGPNLLQRIAAIFRRRPASGKPAAKAVSAKSKRRAPLADKPAQPSRAAAKRARQAARVTRDKRK